MIEGEEKNEGYYSTNIIYLPRYLFIQLFNYFLIYIVVFIKLKFHKIQNKTKNPPKLRPKNEQVFNVIEL